ncbi:MAG: hypothetical protein LUE64_01730 [Candidatus Gastranaerophilales bacterium]|nr:hypothetical protein [Candidatus Gastranaerophilales bacterium]
MNRFLFLLFILFAAPVFAQEVDSAFNSQNMDTQTASIKKTDNMELLTDEMLNAPLPYVHTNYDYTSTKAMPIVLQITEKISTRDKTLYEGKKLYFNIVDAPHFINRRQKIEGRINMITSSGMNGVPYTIIVNDFNIPEIPKEKLKGEYQKSGLNMTWFVLPLKWALTPIPPTGSLTNFILGGHAKITPKDRITLWYYPEWK